jgi:hypothetical protein
MTSADDARQPDPALARPAVLADQAGLADHAGSVLCRLLARHPEVGDIEILGQNEMPDGTITYSLGVMLPGGRELFIDVEDAPPARYPASR